MGHKSPTQKKRKTLVEPDSGMKKTPNANCSSNSDDDLLNFYDDDVMSDDENNGLSVKNLNDDDVFKFLN
mgnify:FL=1